VTSGSTPAVAAFVDSLYYIITAGTYKASSIKVAEAAKVIENTQRDEHRADKRVCLDLQSTSELTRKRC
jgi:UDP-N-acetyl-D-mannosaminuronate dehydrogenase